LHFFAHTTKPTTTNTNTKKMSVIEYENEADEETSKSKRVCLWPGRKQFSFDTLAFKALKDKWCNSYIREKMDDNLGKKFHSTLPIMLRRIMNPLNL
jgi:hypothetical protein